MAQAWRRAADGHIDQLFECHWPVTDDARLERLRAAGPWIVMPDCRGSLLWLDIPSRDREQAERALPFALEEYLLDEPGELHATLGPRPEKTPAGWQWPVLLVERAWREELLERLDHDGIRPAGLVHPLDLEPWPEAPEEWNVIPAGPEPRDAGPLRLVQGPHAGFLLPGDGHSLVDRLADVIGRLPDRERPARLVCHGLDPEQARRLGERLTEAESEHAIAVANRPLPERPGCWFRAIETGRPISAVETAGGLPRRDRRRAWTGAGALALALAAALLGLRLAEGWQAAGQADMLEARIEADFRAALPDTRMVNPRIQIQQAVERLEGSGDAASAFLPLVTAMGRSLNDSGAVLSSLDYRDGRLLADWRGDDYERLQAAAGRLRDDPRVSIRNLDASVEQGRAEMHIELALRDAEGRS